MKKKTTTLHLPSRRQFVKQTAMFSLAASLPLSPTFASPSMAKARKFTLQLDGGSVGIKATQTELIGLASQFGFESVSPLANKLGEMDKKSIANIKAQMAEKKLVWGSAGLPINFRNDLQNFEKGLDKLETIAPKLQQAGITRMGTWIFPHHNELTYLKNFELHRDRIKQIATVLGKYDIRVGLEYVGTRTLWSAGRFPFLHSLAETQELIAAIGLENVGLILDSYHWYNAEETKEDLMSLRNEQVVGCDLNDAVKGLERKEQLDLNRELPMATGVIDLKSFLEALIAIGYDGPIRAEPFSKSLNLLDNETAASAAAQAMKAAFALVE